MKNKAGQDRPLQVEIDRLIHEPARLRLLSQLYVVESADFVFLLRQTGLTQGNVSGHLSKLENAGYVEIEKGYAGKRPHTMISLSKKGRLAFRKYIENMQQVFNGPKLTFFTLQTEDRKRSDLNPGTGQV